MLNKSELYSLYDDQNREFGCVALSFNIYDRRVLIPRSFVIAAVQEDSELQVTLDQIDDLAAAGLISWIARDNERKDEPGLPPYVISRIGLLRQLEQQGWDREELREYVDWEEWLIDDTLADGLSYEDNDIKVITRRFRFDIAGVNDEIWGRNHPDYRPSADWCRTAWSSRLENLSFTELIEKRKRWEGIVTRLENTNMTVASDSWKLYVDRTSFCLRFSEEMVRLAVIGRSRRQLQAGFSLAIQFSGEFSLLPQIGSFEEFGHVDWSLSLESWKFLNDPDGFTFRLPGFLIKGGTIIMTEALDPSEYTKRFEIFRLREYIPRYKKIIGDRRCVYCGKVLSQTASERKRYCSTECSQAARQRAYRQRQKQAALQRITRHPL